MQEIIARVDEALIDKLFQPMVERIAALLPLGCFQQARICTGVAAVAWILSKAADVTAAVRTGMLGPQVFQISLLLLGLGSIMVLHSLFQRGSGQGQANPLRAVMYPHRLCLLFGAAISLLRTTAGQGTWALFTVAIFAVASVYIGSCSNPPPKQQVDLWGRRAATLPP